MSWSPLRLIGEAGGVHQMAEVLPALLAVYAPFQTKVSQLCRINTNLPGTTAEAHLPEPVIYEGSRRVNERRSSEMRGFSSLSPAVGSSPTLAQLVCDSLRATSSVSSFYRQK